MLNDYLAEFRSLRAELERMLQKIGSGEEIPAAVDAKLREIKDCLGALEMELRSMSPAQRSGYLSQLQSCRDDFASLQRRCLMSTSRGREASELADSRRCEQTIKKLHNASVQLDSTRKLAEETEEVGANILCNLYMQRESIQRANRHAEETNASLRESKSLITKMGKWWSGLIG
ncbi:uncharacterized protein LOC34620875 [Cyclospora cayetanensis]|uniref:Uncharacterized protein LOC34620875 n=1 Tax=Cyclospora cayetanensis TaxID=88456 RepID=A0A6P6RPF9_9EIME|nr:uncharacterized protein LOC34620875 [Cyclospora cayetanensis]